jgi:hypothetical protein
VPRRQFQQGAQRALCVQQAAGAGDDIGALPAGAEEDGEQLGIGEHGGAVLEEFLAGAFVVGPVSDLHGGGLLGCGTGCPLQRVAGRPAVGVCTGIG